MNKKDGRTGGREGWRMGGREGGKKEDQLIGNF